MDSIFLREVAVEPYRFIKSQEHHVDCKGERDVAVVQSFMILSVEAVAKYLSVELCAERKTWNIFILYFWQQVELCIFYVLWHELVNEGSSAVDSIPRRMVLVQIHDMNLIGLEHLRILDNLLQLTLIVLERLLPGLFKRHVSRHLRVLLHDLQGFFVSDFIT